MEFTELPADHFGALVENEKDARRLLWLVNQVGEQKLRASAAKRNKYYPESKLFVSVLLKRFNLKVPVHVYEPVRAKTYMVYLLLLRDGSGMKLGFSGDWLSRACSFLHPEDRLGDLFDLQRSQAVYFDSETQARNVEEHLKKHFAESRVESPVRRGLIPSGSSGHGEWFDASRYDDVVSALAMARSHAALQSVCLTEALRQTDQLYDAKPGDQQLPM